MLFVDFIIFSFKIVLFYYRYLIIRVKFDFVLTISNNKAFKICQQFNRWDETPLWEGLQVWPKWPTYNYLLHYKITLPLYRIGDKHNRGWRGFKWNGIPDSTAQSIRTQFLDPYYICTFIEWPLIWWGWSLLSIRTQFLDPLD